LLIKKGKCVFNMQKVALLRF